MYTIYNIQEKEILVRSDDYYARPGDNYEETVKILFEHESFDTEQQAFDELKRMNTEILENLQYKHSPNTYIILKTYQI